MRKSAHPRVSAGLLLYRLRDGAPEVFLAHPGGPFFARKDNGHWTIPKGEPDGGEDLLLTAQREFGEEVGFVPPGPFFKLGTITQKGGKIVYVGRREAGLAKRNETIRLTFSEWLLD